MSARANTCRTRDSRSPATPTDAQRGITLIEVLISLVVSSFVLITIGYAFVTQRSVERHRGALAGIQDSARSGLEILSRDLRQAGYVGCNSNMQRGTTEKSQFETVILPVFDPAVVTAGTENFTIDGTSAIRVFNANSSVAVWGGSIPPNAVSGTHVIEVRYASADGASLLAGPVGALGASLVTRGTVDLGRGDDTPSNNDRMGLLSDCASGMIVRVDAVAGTAVTTGVTKIDSTRCQSATRVGASCFYWPATMLMPVRVVQYYVADTGTASAPKRGLYMRKRIMSPIGISWNNPVQLIDGVQSFLVTGVGLDVAAPAAPTWLVTREVTEASGATAVETMAAAEWPRVLRLDVRLAMRAEARAGTDGKTVVRNFETSFAVRQRAAGDML
jgi:type IV pilus assembly protein PilW